MLRILINNEELELSQEEQVELTYQMSDLDNPTTEKNSFSKTISVKGTPKNNKIFGDYWKLDRSIHSSSGIGASYDARKRVDASIYDNNDIVESGYIKLDDVTINSDSISYEITFFGGIGDFFYNLMYNENGDELSLADLWFKFKDNNGNTYSREEEKDKLLAQWNKDYITMSWQYLGIPPYNFENIIPTLGDYIDDGKLYSYLTAAPTYSGYYDDFDNDKVLINTESIGYHSQTGYSIFDRNPLNTKYFPNVLTDSDNNKYYPKNGWAMVETPRELDEWEVGMLNSSQQRPAFKLSKILEACCDKDNNGGYDVIWDSEVLDSSTQMGKYYHNAYLLMNRFDFEATESKFQKKVELSATPKLKQNERTATTKLRLTGTTTQSIDVSDLANPTVSVTLQPQISFKVSSFGKNGQYPEEMYSEFVNDNIWYGTYIAFQVKTYDNNTLSATSQVYACYADSGQNRYKSTPYVKLRSMIAEAFGITEGTAVQNANHVVLVSSALKASATGVLPNQNNEEYVTYSFENGSGIQVSVPQSSNAKIEVTSKLISIIAHPYEKNNGLPFANATFSNVSSGLIYYGWKDGDSYKRNLSVYDISIGLDKEALNAVFAGSISPTVQNLYVDKNVLFGNTESPYDYLTSFTKLLGLKFYYDSSSKTVHIMTRNNYFKNEVIDLTENVDRGQEIKITPCLTEYKWYKWGLETPESYAQYLYSLKNKGDYGSLNFDTSYYFNKETNEILDDNVYQNVIPYRLASQYLTNARETYYSESLGTESTVIVPKPVLSKTFEYTLWNGDNTYTETRYGYNAYFSLNREYDAFPKVCCFDKDNGNLTDVTNALVLFDGLSYSSTFICDNLQIMYDLNDSPCHIWSTVPFTEVIGNPVGYDSLSSIDKKIIAYSTHLPKFSKYHHDKDTQLYDVSLDFKKPNQTFVDDSTLYVDGITIDNLWNKYIYDIYDKDGKKVELYCIINDNPSEAMRKFYYFDNCLWVLNKITDYKPRIEKPLKCEFIKIVAIKDFTTNPSVDNTYAHIIPRVNNDHYYSNNVACQCSSTAVTPTVISTTETIISKDQNAEFLEATETDLYVTYKVLITETMSDGTTRNREEDRTKVVNVEPNYETNEVIKNGTVTDGDLEISWSVTQKAEENVASRTFTISSYEYPQTVAWNVTEVQANAVGSVRTTHYDGTTNIQLVTTAITITLEENRTTEDVLRTGSFCFGTYCLVYNITQTAMEGNISFTLNDGTVLTYNDTAVTTNMLTNEQRPKVVSVNIGEGVETIGNNAFAYCTAMTSVSISNTVKTIGESAFDSCTSLTSINIPNSVETIEDGAFDTCTALTTLRLGSGIRTLGAGLFIRADLLKRIYYNGTKAQWNAIRINADCFTYSAVEVIICTDGQIEIS